MDKIQNKDWVAKHAFLPFIHYKMKLHKYTVKSDVTTKQLRDCTDKRTLKYKKTKERLIYYASHLDGFIYKYYSDKLNFKYNEYAARNGIDEIAIAYRSNKQGKNNIDFAKEVFGFILQHENAVIIALDFTKFFDKITHKKLKQNLKRVMNVEKLPLDYYKVFKSITNFSYVNKSAINKFLITKYGEEKVKRIIAFHIVDYLITKHGMKKLVRLNKSAKNKFLITKHIKGNLKIQDTLAILRPLTTRYENEFLRNLDDLILCQSAMIGFEESNKLILLSIIQFLIHEYGLGNLFKFDHLLNPPLLTDKKRKEMLKREIAKLANNKILITKYGIEELKKRLKHKEIDKIMSPLEFRKFKKKLIKHQEKFGIPQGSGISAVCSNIYLIDFDARLKKWADSKNALYRRYCDDLILVIPYAKGDRPNICDLKKSIEEIVNEHEGLQIQKEKTEIRIYEDGEIKESDNKPSKIDYLGFLLDGKTIKIREKSVFKYYSRAYRKAKISKERTKSRGIKTYRKKLYQIYTHLGSSYRYGNFISYTKKAHDKMAELPVKVLINNTVKRHWKKIQVRLRDTNL